MINETEYTNNPLTKEQENQIDALFTQFDRNDAPGCAVGVIKEGRFIYKKSFGMANLDYDIPITSDSRFELSSTSKQFTAACIVLLNLDGKLNFDDDVRMYINELPDYGKTITIRHLLNHTSGIRDYFALMSFSDIQFNSFFTTKDGVRLVCKQKELDFLPGEKYSYSNSGYILLAEIINRVSGKTIRQYADEKILKHLEMNYTHYNDDCTETMKNRVISYNLNRDGKFAGNFYNLTTLGDGGVVSTVNDLLKWDNNFYNPQVGGHKLLDHLLTKGILNNGETISYSLGLRQNTFKGLLTINHNGSFFGFRSQLVRFPDHKTSIIILANRADADPDEFANLVADILLKPESDVSFEKKVVTKGPEIISLTESEMEKFLGNFWCNEHKLNRRIYLKNGELIYWRSENSESKLIPISQNELIMTGIQSDVKLVFTENKTFELLLDGKVTSLFTNYQPFEFTIENLARYEGIYFCDELDIAYLLKIKSDKLVLSVKDKQKAELKVFVPDVFEIIEGSCYITFWYDDNKQIAGFKLDTDRAKNIKFIKQS